MEVARLVIGCPADAIALAKSDCLLFGKLKPITCLLRRELSGIEEDALPALAEVDLAIGMNLGHVSVPP